MFDYSIKILREEARRVSRDMGIATSCYSDDETKLMKAAEMEEIVRDLEDAADILASLTEVEDISEVVHGNFEREEEAFE